MEEIYMDLARREINGGIVMLTVLVVIVLCFLALFAGRGLVADLFARLEERDVSSTASFRNELTDGERTLRLKWTEMHEKHNLGPRDNPLEHHALEYERAQLVYAACAVWPRVVGELAFRLPDIFRNWTPRRSSWIF